MDLGGAVAAVGQFALPATPFAPPRHVFFARP